MNKPFSNYLMRFLGSVQLAMLLLAVVIAACIFGTLAESRFDTSVAQAYCYDAPWFIAWLGLLCLNLLFSVLVRYPWKPHQIGFVLTHAGIIVILIGAVVGRIWGIEGMLTLRKGDQPAKSLVINQTMLELKTESDAGSTARAINLRLRQPTPEQPLRLGEMAGIDARILGTAKELNRERVARASDKTGTPALRLSMRSSTMPMPADQWLALDNPRHGRIQFGPSVIQFVSQSTSPAREIATTDQQSKVREALLRERHFLFGKMPDMNLSRPLTGQSSGVKATFQPPTEPKDKGTLLIDAGTEQFTFEVDKILNLETPLPGTPWRLEQVKYFADFRLNGSEPTSASNEPNNPAIVFEITGAASTAPATLASTQHASHSAHSSECNHAAGECVDEAHSCCKDKEKSKAAPASHPNGITPQLANLKIALQPDGTLRFQTEQQGQTVAEGPIRIGEEFFAGLSDWKCIVEEFVPNSVISEEWRPVGSEPADPSRPAGVLVELTKGTEQLRRWIAIGEPEAERFGNERIQLVFGYRLHPLDFAVSLDRFEVERDEGTQTPAGFKSHVRFIGSDAKSTETRPVWMNNPATFPDVLGATWLGRAYKFSQASWNPNDLNQTTLQVLRDPGWFFKWTGSLILCVGLFTMFYLKPYFRRQTQVQTQA